MYLVAFIALTISLSSLWMEKTPLIIAVFTKLSLLTVFAILIAFKYKSIIKTIYINHVKKTTAH